MTDYRLLPAGDTALTVEFGDGIDRVTSGRVLALANRIAEARIAGITDCVPTFRSLTIHFDPLLLPPATLGEKIGDLAQGLQAAHQPGRTWHLPVCYDDSPDLAAVATHVGLTPAQVIERHSSVTYHVYMLGFLPGQPYLGDVVRELSLPRRQSPRTKIPAGSVAIAMTMTCIFPRVTPCGWHLIGRCPVPLWDGAAPLLAPGDRVALRPVSLREYERLVGEAAAGALAARQYIVPNAVKDVAA